DAVFLRVRNRWGNGCSGTHAGRVWFASCGTRATRHRSAKWQFSSARFFTRRFEMRRQRLHHSRQLAVRGGFESRSLWERGFGGNDVTNSFVVHAAGKSHHALSWPAEHGETYLETYRRPTPGSSLLSRNAGPRTDNGT